MSTNSPRFPIDASPTSPSSQRSSYPFPPTPSARYERRRGSNASISSVGSVSSSSDRPSRRGATVRETSQNAISTLLQPPIVRTGLVPHTQASAAAAGYKAPTTRDIPPVALTNIPQVSPEHFRDYLTRIGPLFESFTRGRSEEEQPAWLHKDLDRTDSSAEALGRRPSNAPQSPTLSRRTSATSLSSVEKPRLSRRRSSGQARRNRNEPTPLSTIPGVYFDVNFHLENPRTFDVVSERAEIVRPPPGTPTTEQKGANGATLPPRKALATNAILQEKLSWYMDTVEVHLINNISSASTGFFAALGSLKELQTEAEQSVAQIQSLRKDLRKLDQEVAIGGLEVAAKRRRRANVQKLTSATAQVQRVVENVKRADELVDQGNYDEAADQMVRVGRLVCGKHEPGSENNDLIDLRPLKAMQGLDSGLQEMQLRIGNGYAQRFTQILMEDLRSHIERVPPSDTLRRWSRERGVPPVYMETDDTFRKHLLAALKGLQRAGHTAPATTAYREAVTKEMKSIIRKYLPSSNDDDADSMISTSTRGGHKLNQQEKSSILARNLRSLDDADSEHLVIKIYTSVGEALRRVSTQTKVLLDVTSSMQAPEPKSPPKLPIVSALDDRLSNGTAPLTPKPNNQEELTQALDMSSLIGQAVDTAQTQITRVLKVRNERSVRLPKERFLRYFMLNRLFADECEAVSGRGGQVLKGIINAQISGFVQVLGATETERIAHVLDGDDWNAVDFSDSDGAMLQRILKSMTTDPPEWAQVAKPIWEDLAPVITDTQTNGVVAPASNGTPTPNTNGAPSSKVPAAKPAYIDETRYILVSSAASLLRTIDNFLSLTASMSSMTPAILASLLEVLRTYNSRSSQLILGAGATRVAGLKNITTKHLSLSSQALSFVIALTPYMRECARRHLPSGQTNVLAEFDRTKRLYQDHQSGIHDKLVDIMTGRSQAHVKAMSAISYSDSSAPKDDKASPYMETLTKETLTLHRVLARHLTDLDVSIIIRQIFASYKEQWTKAFNDTEVSGLEGERKLLRDAECFDVRLSKIEGFGDIGKEVLAVVHAKISGAEKGGEEPKTNGEEKGKQSENE